MEKQFDKNEFRKRLLKSGFTGEEIFFYEMEILKDSLFPVSFNLSSTNQSHVKIRDKIRDMTNSYIESQKISIKKLEKGD